MASLKIDAMARHDAASAPRRVSRPSRIDPTLPVDAARGRPPFRGLLYGLPIGLAMWLLLALLIWRLA